MVEMMYIGLYLLLNVVFAILIWRISGWFKITTEDFWFYMLNFNLVAILIIINEYYGFTVDYSFGVKYSVIVLSTFIIMEFFKKRIIRTFRGLMKKQSKDQAEKEGPAKL